MAKQVVLQRRTLLCVVRFESYIAHPYWPEKGDLIDIQKKSGMNRVRSDEKREKSLATYLESIGMTAERYAEIVELSERQWYRQNGAVDSPIVIPRHQISAALVECCKSAPAAVRAKLHADSLRHHLRLSDFVTDKKAADGVFDRYVKLETSNQRSRQRNEFIRDFAATGTIDCEPDAKLDQLQRFLEYAFREVGVGASRKMGYGRGRIESLEEAK